MDPGHGGGCSHPPGKTNPGTTYPSGHTSDPATYELEGSRALGREAPLRAHCGARSGGSPVPYKTCFGPGVGGLGMAVSRLSSQDHVLAGSRATSSVQSHTPGRYFLS